MGVPRDVNIERIEEGQGVQVELNRMERGDPNDEGGVEVAQDEVEEAQDGVEEAE